MKLFNAVQGRRPQKALFDLSHERKLSFGIGTLIPIFCEEVVPGDKFKLSTELLVRMAPLKSPVMHRIDVHTEYFFVPNRLIWDNWQKFITGGVNGTDEPVHPYLTATDASGLLQPGSLVDHLGYSTTYKSGDTPKGKKMNALPFRAYQKIVNDYYIDLTLNQGENEFSLGDGDSSADNTALLTLRQRAWEKDYFTSALPWTQRGGEVSAPLFGQAPVQFDQTPTNTPYQYLRNRANKDMLPGEPVESYSNGALVGGTSNTDAVIDLNGSHYANLDEASGTSINELRKAVKLQEWLERQARGGSRYIETILSHFGVKTSDYRLQRSEFLGGGKSPIVVSEVLQTSGTTDQDAQDPLYNSPLGEMGGHAAASGATHGFNKYFEEHGFIIGIMSVRPRSAYMQGARKFFTKENKFDYYWPEFAQLGEQPVMLSELYNNSTIGEPDPVFGYQSRYAELKYIPSSVHGDFKTNLDFWHLARKFDSAPALNNTFVKIQEDPRIFAVTDPGVSKLWAQVYHNCRAIRPIPYFNNPSLL